MKRFFNLAHGLRVFFGAAQLLTILSGVVFLFSLTRADPFIPLTLTDVYVKIPSTSLVVKTPTSNPEDIRVTRLTTTLKLNPRSTDTKLVAAIRWTLLPACIVGFIFLWMYFGLLRKLCARVEQGEIFSEANIRSVRNLGLLIMAEGLISGFLQFWTNFWFSLYLTKNATLTGLAATLDTEMTLGMSLTTNSSLITGLLVLLVAEAFRQGLALKKENELTV